MCYNKEKEKRNMKNLIKEMIAQFKNEKTFLETKIKWGINDLQFYNHFNYNKTCYNYS